MGSRWKKGECGGEKGAEGQVGTRGCRSPTRRCCCCSHYAGVGGITPTPPPFAPARLLLLLLGHGLCIHSQAPGEDVKGEKVGWEEGGGAAVCHLAGPAAGTSSTTCGGS